jgi:flavodoxin
MKILIIYDSVFGNTEQVARAMGDALKSRGELGVYRISTATPEPLKGLDLLIVGSPTRGFRPTEPIQTFLKNIPAHSLRGVKAAAFDIRIGGEDIQRPILRGLVKLEGNAAKPIGEALKKKGGSLVAEGEGFFVKGTESPLKEGELERAAV